MKPASAKAKGQQAEKAVVEWLRVNGVPYAERRRLNGRDDQGDITGWPGVCIEVKAEQKFSPSEWLKELDKEIVNARAETGFVFAKRPGTTNPAEWYAILRPAVLLELMREAGWMPPEHPRLAQVAPVVELHPDGGDAA